MTKASNRLTRRDRFRIKEQVLAALGAEEWTWNRVNLLLSEFGLPQPEDGYGGMSLSDCLAEVADADLLELAAIVLDMEEAEVAATADLRPEVAKNWKPGYLRVFLSHSAKRKADVAKIADELAIVGIHGFVAHDTLEYTKPWQEQIEAALRSMEAFVAIVHPELAQSSWCHQEIGWAFGRGVPIYAVRVGTDPDAFLRSRQWPSADPSSPADVAHHISSWVAKLPGLGTQVIDGLINELRTAGNYFVAEAAAKRIAALGTLTEEQFESINEAWWVNDQLHGGYLPTNVMASFYLSHGREWPPPKPSEPEDELPF